VDARKILEKCGQYRSYAIPLHEFARGVMFADREYYSERGASLVMNVFDCQSGDPRESFLVCGLLATLHSSTNDADSEANGYLGLDELRVTLMGAGYSYEQVSWVVARCLQHRLIETNVKSADVVGASHARLSPAGSYYLLKLARTFVYVDAVCMDTPISDPKSLDAIADTTLLDGRMERSASFVCYLSRVFAQAPALRSLCDWDGIARDIGEDIERARASNAQAMRKRQAERDYQ